MAENKPIFRRDLTCSREEQQGVVFYRVDDPKTQTSFRLYEIEYLIAQKLDGSRTLPEVIAAVKAEFNFDISESDLDRFMGQLESMGFLSGSASTSDDTQIQAGVGPKPATIEPVPTSASQDFEGETAVMEEPQPLSDDMIEMLDPISEELSDKDKAQRDKLLHSALAQLKQGYLQNARDYLLAARELDPGDERIVLLSDNLGMLTDTSTASDLEYLWNQAAEKFPEVASALGPFDPNAVEGLTDGRAAFAPNVAQSSHDEHFDDEPEGDPPRVLLARLAIIIGVVVVGVGGIIAAVKMTGVFADTPVVKVSKLSAERVAVHYENPAEEVIPVRERWLSFSKGGDVSVLVKPEQKVQAGEVIARLQLPKKIEKKLNKARAAVKKAQSKYDAADKKMEKLRKKREKLEVERDEAQNQLRELRPKGVLKRGGVSKRDIKKWTKLKVAANKKLSKLAKKERKPKTKLAAAEKKLEQARRSLEEAEKKIGDSLLRAPFSGVVVKLGKPASGMISSGHKLILLRDDSAARVTFSVSGKPPWDVGGEAYVAVGLGVASKAKIAALEPKGELTQVRVDVPDPTGVYFEKEPKDFRLVREYVDAAYKLPSSAIAEENGQTFVVVALEGKGLRRSVEVLEHDAAKSIVRDASGSLRATENFVYALVGSEEGISEIADGSALEITN